MTLVSELGTPVLRAVDRGAFVVALGERLRSEGVPVTFTALAALTEGLEASAPRDLSALYWLARITLVNRHQDLPTFDRVFDQVFRDSALPLGGQAAGPIYRGDPATSEADRGAVYYARADGSGITEAIFPLERPNGIGLSPDERTLYVVETPTARCWAFTLSGPGRIESANGVYRGEKGRVVVGLGGYQMFDSLAVDAEGHVAAATLITGAVSDIWPDGSRVDQYLLPDMMVTNVCFGGPGLRTAFATLSLGGALVAFEWPRPGLPLHHLQR